MGPCNIGVINCPGGGQFFLNILAKQSFFNLNFNQKVCVMYFILILYISDVFTFSLYVSTFHCKISIHHHLIHAHCSRFYLFGPVYIKLQYRSFYRPVLKCWVLFQLYSKSAGHRDFWGLDENIV